jgi:PIN domain nuclease of toxin-antitoxin system
MNYGNTLYISSIVVQELILLYKIGKIRIPFNTETAIYEGILDLGIHIVYFNEYHLRKYISLQLTEGHKDMNDHAIIAQAISDKIPLISSDHAFQRYVSQGLNFIFNRR